MYPGAIILPLGLLLFGFCIRYYTAHASYVGACTAIAVRSAILLQKVKADHSVHRSPVSRSRLSCLRAWHTGLMRTSLRPER